MAEREKKEILIIEFKDGSSIVIDDPIVGAIREVIKDFQDGQSTISIGRISGGLEKTVISTSGIRALIPQWKWIEIAGGPPPEAPKKGPKRPPPGAPGASKRP